MTRGICCQEISLVRRGSNGSEKPVLNAVSVQFRPGRVALITGATGAGKSSLLHMIAGLIRPTSGTIVASGRPVSRWITAHRDRWRRQVGIVFQHAALLDGCSAMENVMLPLIPREKKLTALRRKADEALQRTEIRHLAGEEVGTLSGGERQRVAVARAIVSGPAFLIADEPTAFQDEEGTRIIGNILSAAARENATVIVASHDPKLMGLNLADDRFQLKNGCLLGMDN